MKKNLAFFGAFNPPTLAHLDLAKFALDQTGGETVIFVPSKEAYIREEQGKDFAYTDQQRLAMLNAAAANRPWMKVSDWELRQEKQPRTFFTLCALQDQGLEAALLIGSDKLKELGSGWLFVEDIARDFGIVCLTRAEDDCDAVIRADPLLRRLRDFIQVLPTPASLRHVSSTAVRRRMMQIKTLQAEIQAMTPEEIIPLL